MASRRLMEFRSPLGSELLFHRMSAREELGRLSEYQIELLSADGAVPPDEILGKGITVVLELPHDKVRHFHGYVTRFAQQGILGRYNRYHATVHSWPWFLTRTSNCRIFQDLSVDEILKQVFDAHPVADVKFELTGNYRKWEYCVQYRETDFNFVSRLMEQEGIYYFFKHEEDRHTMVIADSYSAHTPFEGYEKLPYIPAERAARLAQERITHWSFVREIQPGAYVIDDYDFENPSNELKVQHKIQREFERADYEVYDYPGEYVKVPDGEQYVRTRLEELHAGFELAHGSTNARGFAVGHLFELTGQSRRDQNREYLVTKTRHELEFSEYEGMEGRGASYSCDFTVLCSKEAFRTATVTPKPIVQGPQTAVVVGPKGDEIYTDKYGRVKVQFHWDRIGKKDENSSCWIRVSSPWAGKGWGGVSTPRIGQEVIVDFLEGDPDRPIITGRVYNAENMPPFGFPAGAVLSGFKSKTHKGSGNNELSMDDTAGKERFFIHGQYNMDTVVEHDQTSTIHNNRTDKVDVDDSETVGGNQTLHVVKNQTTTVGGHRKETVNSGEDVTIIGGRTHSITGTQSTTTSLAETRSVGLAYQVTVGAAMNESIGAVKMEEIGGAKIVGVGAYSSENVAISKSVNAGSNISEKAGKAFTASAGTDFKASAGGAFSATAGKTMSLKSTADFSAQSDAKGLVSAADELVLQCGSAKIILKKDGTIEIEGKDVAVKGSGKIVVDAGGDLNLKGSKINQNS